jgi:hypothetical protein
MIIGESPYSVVATKWHTWFCEGPYQSGKQWKTEKEAIDECNLLNSVYNTGAAKTHSVSDVMVCKLPYQDDFFVHAQMDGKDVWLCQDGTWTFNETDEKVSLPGNTGLKMLVENKDLAKLESDIANAYRCAKEYVPDYPWDDSRQTASQAVWACGESYSGVCKACEDWQRLFKHFAPDAYSRLLSTSTREYIELVKKLEEQEKKNES